VRCNAEYLRSPVTDAKPYQNFFNSLEKAMFLEAHQGLTPSLPSPLTGEGKGEGEKRYWGTFPSPLSSPTEGEEDEGPR